MIFLRRAIQVLACILLSMYVMLIFALDLPRVQTYLADVAEEQLGKVLNSKVEIDRINVGLFNAVELHDVTLYDQSEKVLLKSKLIYGKVRIASIIKGKIDLRNISILDATIQLYKNTAEGPLNLQFVIDAFKSDNETKRPLDLTINSLLLRRCQIAYDERYEPQPEDNRFTPHHIFMHDVNANVSLKQLTDDKVKLRIRQLSLMEQSGFAIEALHLRLEADRRHAVIRDFYLKTPHSLIDQQVITADYQFTDLAQLKQTLTVKGNLEQIRIATTDLATFAPTLKKVNQTVRLRTSLTYHNASLSLHNMIVSTPTEDFLLMGDVDIKNGEKMNVTSSIHRLYISQDLLRTLSNDLLNKELPKPLHVLGNIDLRGNIKLLHDKQANSLASNNIGANIEITTALGNLACDISLENDRIALMVYSPAFRPAALYDHKYIPSLVDFKLTANTYLSPLLESKKYGKAFNIGPTEADIVLNAVTIDNKTYKDIHSSLVYNAPNLQLLLNTNDPGAKMQAEINTSVDTDRLFSTVPESLNFNLNVDHLSPGLLHLSQKFGDGVFAAQATGALYAIGTDDIQADVNISDFNLSGDNDQTTPYHLDNLNLQVRPIDNGSHVKLRSDFADIDYSGPIELPKLKKIVSNIYSNVKEGVFNEALSANAVAHNYNTIANTDDNKWGRNINFILSLRNAEFFNRLLGFKINYNGIIQAQGSATDDGNHLTLSCHAPSLTFGKFTLNDLSLYVRNEEGSFNVLGKGRRMLKNGDLRIEMTAINRDGKILTDIEWDESMRHAYYGKLSSVSTIDMSTPTREALSLGPISPDDSGMPMKQTSNFSLVTEFVPSQVCIADSLWQFSPSRIEYRDKRVKIEGFGIHNPSQSLAINGTYDRAFEDAITIDLKNLDLDYVLSFVRLNVVNFSGHATGKIFVRALPDGSPWARAEINVPDMLFNHAPFGNADIVLGWDHAAKDITIQGHIEENGIGYTNVWGYVDPVNRDLDLRTESKNTPLAFLNQYTADIFDNLSGRATGHCRIHGGFQTIEFVGHEIGQIEATVPVTGVTYVVKDADVDILPQAFSIKSANIYDKFGGEGTASGALTHLHLKEMAYDFRLQGTNLRLYDKTRELDMPFFATATGSGDVHLHGKSGELGAEMRIRTTPGSELTYLLDSPDADVSQLLSFHDVTPLEKDTTTSLLPIFAEKGQMSDTSQQQIAQTIAEDNAPKTDINLYFEVDVDNNSCLHLITDDKSGDAITTYGSGPIQANYHNKSGFQMFGTYNIDRGTYNLNIPTLAQRRKFDILSGGRVTFSGDPSQAEVKVKAQYVVNSASLSDLNIGTGFGNNTTRVNCLVDIYGEVANMQFDLGIELPNCSEDEQQMVNQLIATDEDRTMQVLYLLGVGRFYAYNYTTNEVGQSQSMLMMNSLLSSTLSSQLNSIISNAVGSSNWTFGTNISTGQLGWNDMEVEGLVSSRLLNNRLLLNGNFGYSDRRIATTNFVGDFDMQYLITPKGTVSIKAYSETNDRYFTKSTLTTQGVGFELKKEFTRFIDLFRRRRNKTQLH